MEDYSHLKHVFAVSLLYGIGNKKAKDLIAYCGSAEAVFSKNKRDLAQIPGIGKKGVSKLNFNEALIRAEEEMEKADKMNWNVYSYLSKNYPGRLKHCVDSPLILFSKGQTNFDYPRTVSIVGTRNCTQYGKQIVDNLIDAFSQLNVQVISGLAYGIDIYTHRACLKKEMSTIGVLAHGLDRLYPSQHTKIAIQMEERGGVLTEFLSGTNPDRVNFPTRNRIVAGMSDATIVVESGEKGGSLITAYMANDYNRDVFAFPGDINKPYSKGCNDIIKKQKAHLATSVDDILYLMNWNKEEVGAIQTQLFTEFTPDEQEIADALKERNEQSIDELSGRLKKPVSVLSSLLLTMEFGGSIKSLPGKRYLLV